jgi:hypothetical protein
MNITITFPNTHVPAIAKSLNCTNLEVKTKLEQYCKETIIGFARAGAIKIESEKFNADTAVPYNDFITS